jgi:hypothetical protein
MITNSDPWDNLKFDTEGIAEVQRTFFGTLSNTYSFFALYANIGYFAAMSASHWVGFKVPILFIYYDTPFHPYQDKIISFCAGTYAILNLAAARHRAVVPYVVASLALTTVGLSAINASDDLRKVLPAGASTSAYWLQTGMIGALTGMLAVLHVLSFAKNKSV